MIVTPPIVGIASKYVPFIGDDSRWADRAAAGRGLARLLRSSRYQGALVLALPPGGVVVAGELARALHLPLDVLVAREVTVRPYPAVIAGAVSEGGGLCFNRAALRLPGLSVDAVWHEARRAWENVAALVALYRHGRLLPHLNRRTVILVDDELGSGLVQLAALQAMHRAHAQHCILATPTGGVGAIQRVAQRADTVLALVREDDGRWDGAAHWRHAFGDDEAAALLERYRWTSRVHSRG